MSPGQNHDDNQANNSSQNYLENEAKLIEEHDRFAKVYKKVETSFLTSEKKGAIHPVLNECRYALRAFVDILKKANNVDIEFEDSFPIEDPETRLFLSIRFAYHDLLDYVVTAMREYIGELVDKYDADIVAGCCEEYTNHSKKLREAEEKLAQSRADREARHQTYMKIEEDYIDGLIEFYHTLRDSEARMAAKYKKENQAMFWNKYGVIIGIFIGLCGLIVAYFK